MKNIKAFNPNNILIKLSLHFKLHTTSVFNGCTENKRTAANRNDSDVSSKINRNNFKAEMQIKKNKKTFIP
jgi:hypothetical protein